MSSFCGLPTEVWSTESTTFPTLLEAPSNFIVPALFKLTGVVFHRAVSLAASRYPGVLLLMMGEK